MFSLPDFKEKQLLIISADREVSNKLSFRNDNLVYKKDGKIVDQASCHKVFCVFLVGDCSITTKLIREFKYHGMSLFLLNWNLKFYAAVNSQTEGHFLLRGNQYNLSLKRGLAMTKNLVENKIFNQFRLLKKVGEAPSYLKKEIKDKVAKAENLDSLRGIEGNCSREFFSKYFKEYAWFKRLPRSKVDETNLLMDVGYTMLFNFMGSILRSFGFDTYCGFFHTDFWQRESLPCDIMEPFRCLVDTEIRRMYRLKIFKKSDFKCVQGRYILPYKNSSKYTVCFLEGLMRNKAGIFSFCQQFYRHFMDEEKTKFPKFNIR